MAALPSVANPGDTGVYWTGGDGNVYVKQANQDGVRSFGTPDQLAAGSKLSGFNVLNNLTQIGDPNAQANGNGGGGGNKITISPNPNSGGAASTYKDKTNEIGVNNAGLAANDTQTKAGIDAINTALGTLKTGYSNETAANEGNYTNESNSNENTRQGGRQTALVNAAQGRQGLFGTLSSIGALSGDSIQLANQAVQNGANVDLHGVGTTFANNQSALDTAIGTYRRQNADRLTAADDDAANAIKNENARGASARQTFLTNLGSNYQDEGKTAEAKTYFDQAGALYPTIAANNVPTARLTPQAAAYTAPALSTYLNGNNATVQTTPAAAAPGSLPGLSAISGKRQQAGLAVA